MPLPPINRWIVILMDEKDAIEKAYDLTISLSEGFSDYSLWLLNKIPEKYVISFIWGTIIIGIIVRKNVDKTAGLLIMLPCNNIDWLRNGCWSYIRNSLAAWRVQ